MTGLKNVFSLVVLLFWLLPAQAQERSISTLQEGWKFARGEQANGASPTLDDTRWETLSVPHDWAISGPFDPLGNGNTAKLPWQGQGWYRRTLDLPATAAGQRIYLLFDGVMAFPKVYLNGQLVGEWDYGYNSFYLDVTDQVIFGQPNLLAVHADTRAHDSRWYPGGGLYRKVQLLLVDPVHVAIWGTFITTPLLKPHYADVNIRSTINNDAPTGDTVRLKYQLISPNGQVVATGKVAGYIGGGQHRDLETTITLPQPQRWDVDQPVLYQVKTEVFSGGRLTDTEISDFGVRSIRFTADHGFYLNDRRVQLRGVNLHHDQGPLGAAFHPRALERQLQLMKAMGVNAIRTSHNVAAPEMLALCDRLGLLFFNEIFDKYDAKADLLEGADFEEFAQRNIRNFVHRDRNHPSLFIWSVGNEIPDVQWNLDNGFQRLQTMLNYVRKYDPTRPTTLVCDSWQSAKLRHFDYYDVHSWNYDRRYRLARQLEPNKSVIISESASTVSTRGFYELPLPEDKTHFTRSLQVSSYDLNAPAWAEIADDDFMWQQEEEYIAGEFVWTGFDYLGEPTPYDNGTVEKMGLSATAAARSSYFGIVDLVGIPKDRYYLYKSYWKPEETTLHILPHWNWPGRVGLPVPVFVYTNGDCAELFVNGKSQGMRCKDPKSTHSVDRFRLMWKDVVYQPGTLRVVAYRAGEVLGEQQLATAGPPTQLRLTPDRQRIQSDGMDLSYILVEALDAAGNLAPLADQQVQVSITGGGQIAGLGNGNPQSLAPFQGEQVQLFYGKAMLIVKAAGAPGAIRVAVSAAGLKAAATELVGE
ncbi:MAG: glycoside hydrolase family 2 [Bacteroidetes bacterium]|nr:MAG: glycoside hydrolase family 2 [Bacteroidota bacterium]PTM14561.1 MAG: glycoside hydrolase family 2 [Bacteroidota bacterium]